jgi:hypothetical protein
MADLSYLAWVRSQPCACQPCTARSQAHHPTNGETERHAKSVGGRRGLGQKAADATAFPLCLKHHAELHDGHGFFEDMDQTARRLWQDDQARYFRELYEGIAKVDPQAVKVRSPKPTMKQEAEAFMAYHSLGTQVAHDLVRLLRKAARGEMVD